MANTPLAAPIRLLLLDVDGTLIGEDLNISPRVQQAVEAAHQQGVQIALCTGRPEIGTRRYIDALHLPGFHIFDSGATIADPIAGITLYQKGITQAVANEMLNYARQHNVYIEVYSGSNYFVAYESEHTLIHTRLQQQPPTVTDLADMIARLPVVKMEAVVIGEEEAARAQAMLDHFSNDLDYGWATAPGVTARFCNILAKGLSKGDAVKRLIEHTGIPVAQVMAIGDGPNDEPLLQAVGVRVAMGNATPTLKQMATWITTSVDEDGVAVAIDRFILSDGH
ncbi:MAG: Cof-type HAD-IIB family hydrolase [Chloroflexota bacterium]